MAELAWQGLPKDGTKGGDSGPCVVVWDGDPEKGMLTLGRWLSSLDAGVRPTLRVGRRMDLARNAQRAQTLIDKLGMLAYCLVGTSPHCCTCLELSWVGSNQPSSFPLPHCYSLEIEVSLRQVGGGEWKEAGKGPELFSLCPSVPS